MEMYNARIMNKIDKVKVKWDTIHTDSVTIYEGIQTQESGTTT
jgi:hypothetical protein